jgi:hypothetical protein
VAIATGFVVSGGGDSRQNPFPMESERPRTSIKPPSAVPLVLVVLSIVAAAGGGLYWFLRKAPPPPSQGAPVGAVDGAPAAATGPAVDAGRQRSLLEAVSPDPTLRRLLGEAELARRWAVAVENLANDVVPRKQLEPFAPAGSFAVVRRGGTAFIDPQSYKRHDLFGDAVASVNVDALVIAYAALRPGLEAAYRALGYPDGSIDRAAARALHRIELAPVRDGELAVVEGPGTTWAYADPALERLGDVDKQMMRLGPRNERILQEKAREISRALGLGTPAR